MKANRWMVVLALGLSGGAQASDGLSSELSHAAGGALLAGAVTRACHESEHRVGIGFGVSAAGIVLSEWPGLHSSDPAKVRSSRLDVTYHVVGAALGAWATDRYILMPVVKPDYVGVLYMGRF